MHKLYWRDWRPVVAREHDEDKSRRVPTESGFGCQN